MKQSLPKPHRSQTRPLAPKTPRWLGWLAAGSALVLLVSGLLNHLNQPSDPPPDAPALQPSGPAAEAAPASAARAQRATARAGAPASPKLSAEETVAHKAARFVQSRRDLLAQLAAHLQLEVPPELEQFFDLAAAGSREEIQKRFQSIAERRQHDDASEALARLWPVVLETFGVLEQTHLWPAQQLLDYGQAILGSLRPDMVYLGGTDPGRFIPTLLNETGESEPRVVLTQNALADASYLDYANFLYADRLKTLGPADAQQAFQDYLADAQRRLAHDQAAPAELPQIRPGEQIQLGDNRVQVSGQIAVMAINERLLNALLDKNPGVGFALEQSFGMVSTYSTARPLGPLLELRAADAQSPLPSELAAPSLDYFRAAAGQWTGDPAAADASARAAYATLATAQANLFAHHQRAAEAEQLCRLAAGISPASAGPIYQLAQLLANGGRLPEAQQLLADFAARNRQPQP